MNFILITGIVIFFIISILVAIAALTSPIPRKIGIRNIARRIDNTLLVILGSMVGAALISGSLVLSDSLDKTFENIVREQVGEMDVLLTPNAERVFETPEAYISEEEVQQVRNLMNEIDDVDDVLALNYFMISPVKLDQKGEPELNAYQVTLYGFDQQEYNSFFAQSPKIDKFESPESVFITEYLAEKLDAKAGDTIRIPLAGRFIDAKVQKVYERGYIPGDPVILIDKDYLNSQVGFPKGASNSMAVSAQGGVIPENYDGPAFEDAIQEKLDTFESENVSFTTYEAKDQALNGFGMGMIADIFLLMSAFGIFAGVLLIINLYLMLAQERKYEMGILRAIALTRISLIKAFLFEGYIYSVLSAFVGAIVGLGVGYFLVLSLDNMFGSIFEAVGMEDIFKIVFDFQIESLIAAFVFGAIVSIITSFFASVKIGLLNIVSAIRNIEEEKNVKFGVVWVLVTIFLSLMTFLSVLNFIGSFLVGSYYESAREKGTEPFASMSESLFNETVSGIELFNMYAGVVMSLFFGSFLVNRFVFLIFKKNIARYTISMMSLIIIVFTALLSKFDVFADAAGSSLALVVLFLSGIVMVVALALLVTYNLSIFTKFTDIIFSPFKRLSSVMKIALRYPSVDKARTGLTLIMFAIVIFLIVYTSMLKVTMKQMNENSLKESLGGYQVLVYPSPLMPRDEVQTVQKIIQATDDVKEVSNFTHLQVIMPDYKYKDLEEGQVWDNPYMYQFNEEDPFQTYLDALPSDFLIDKTIKLDTKIDRYESDEDVWADIINSNDKVVLGPAFTEPGYGRVPKLKVGDKVVIADKFQTEKKEFEIIATIENDASGGLSATASFYPYLVVDSKTLESIFSQEYKGMFSRSETLVKFDEGADVAERVKDIKKDLITYDIMQIFELDELSRVTQGFTDSMILMFQAFMGFSLVVGVSGLAIIITRSVQERRQQIGMLRSLGFRRWMVLAGFIIETTFITFLGLAIGISMGTVGALNQFYASFSDQENLKPVFAYKEVLIISLLVYVASLLFSILPSIKAARLSPVEATNYPE